jgi:hypothetical protein
MVNERKQVAATGSAIVTFMGAEGSSVAVEVPKVCYDGTSVGVVDSVNRCVPGS